MTAPDIATFTVKTFDGHVGEAFTLTGSDLEPIELELADVRGTGGDSDAREPFAVTFLGPLEPVLPQQIYTLQHAEIGTMDLFLVPVGPSAGNRGMQYEAVFS